MATQRQRQAAKNVVENGGIVSRAMIDANYSPKTAKNPEKLTNSKGWQELMSKHLPDSALAKKHRELLNKREYITIDGESEDVGPETQAVSKALDMAYKLKGKYVNEDNQSNKTLIVMISGESSKRYAIATHGIPEDNSSQS